MRLAHFLLVLVMFKFIQAAREDSPKSLDDDFYLVFSPIKNSKSSSHPAESKEEKASQESRYGAGGYSYGAVEHHHGYGGGGGGAGGGYGGAGAGGGYAGGGYGGGGSHHSGTHESYKTPYSESYAPHYPSTSLFGEKVKIAALLTLVNLNVLALYLTYKLASSNVTVIGRSQSGWEYDLTCGACSYLSDLVNSTGAEGFSCSALFPYCGSDQ